MLEVKDGIVTMTAEEYQKFLDDSNLLDCLRAAGVDNWDGWDEAVEMFHAEED